MRSIDSYWYSRNLLAWLLFPLSLLFCAVSFIRRQLYQRGWLASYRAPVPVIVVGNITVGGTGKTPLIVALVKRLQAQGMKPGVISRGYGSRAPAYPYDVQPQSKAREAGDEPLLIARRTNCPVIIGADRRQDIEALLSHYDCNIVLSDDGLQHYALQRDIEIAVMDKSRQTGNGFCLPAGPLRERPARLQTVDMVIYNGAQGEIYMDVQAGRLRPLFAAEAEPLQPQKVHGVAGIGNPRRFFDLLASLGYEVIPHEFADHHDYQPADLQFNDDLPVIMTEKDAVKCMDFALPRHWYLPIEVRLSPGAEERFEQLIRQIGNG